MILTRPDYARLSATQWLERYPVVILDEVLTSLGRFGKGGLWSFIRNLDLSYPAPVKSFC